MYFFGDGLTSMPTSEPIYSAQTEFVICDCTIEKRLHWRRDVTLGEDSCHGVAPGILARFNSAVLSLMDRLGVHNVALQARFFDAPVEAVVQALFSGHCSVF